MNTGPFFIRLQHADGRLPVCASKFWGNPDLPEDVDYPMAYYPDTDSYEPYHFICQINFADLPPQDILPRRGLLQFYANIHYYLGWDCDVEISGYPSGADMVKVLYFPDPDPASFRTVVVVGDDESDVLFPHEMAEMVHAALDGRMEEAERLNSWFSAFFKACFIETNPIPIKTAMASQGWCREIFRLPLCQLESEEHRSQLLSVVGKMMDDRKEGRI